MFGLLEGYLVEVPDNYRKVNIKSSVWCSMPATTENSFVGSFYLAIMYDVDISLVVFSFNGYKAACCAIVTL